ncbi:MAG: hypothetical protein Q9162_005081 [Coniocarpon cinnabarinum]
MTVTDHTALYHFTVPSSTSDGSPISPLMILDLTDLNDSRQNATVNVDANTGRITANGTFLPSFGSGSFESYVCADFQGASVRDTGVYVNSRAGTFPKSLFVERGINLFYIQAGGIVRFNAPDNGFIAARVGVSLVSTDQACQNAENEIPDWNFDGIRSAAEDAWRQKLDVISVDPTGVDDDLLRSFWSGIYRTMISPQNYTGENPLWQSSEPYFDSFYCLWDQFRAQLPLLTVIDPMGISDMMRSLIDTYQHVGWLPDCRMSLSKGFTQGGSNADVSLVDAYVKSIPNVDYEAAYAAIVNDAENEPIDWSVEGRGGSISWKTLNYIPSLDYDYLGFGTNSRSISRTVEYAYNDYCVSSLATSLNHPDDAAKYAARSTDWRNLFLPNQTSALFNGTDTGFTGYFQPRYLNGTFGFLDPVACSSLDTIFCSLTSNPTEVFESSIWEYQFYVPHQNAELITLLGGRDTFIRRFDYLHTSGLIDIGNEPSFLTVYQYNYAAYPAGSARRAHFYIPSKFNGTTSGLPGNDDSGAMGSFLAWSMAGLFPNPGQNVYLIGSPFFKRISFTNPMTGANATIIANGVDPPAYHNIYVQSATLNGTNYTRNWIGHEFFLFGGELVLEMGSAESEWGTGDGDVPPSFVAGNNSSSMSPELYMSTL